MEDDKKEYGFIAQARETYRPACPDLKERLEVFYKKTIDDIHVGTVQEIDTGNPVGEEYW